MATLIIQTTKYQLNKCVLSVYITCSGILVKNVKKVYQKLLYSQYAQGVTNPLYKRKKKEHHLWNPEAQYSWETRENSPYANEPLEITEDNPCQFVPTDEVGLSLLDQDCSRTLFFLHKWFCENAVLSLSDSAMHLAVQMTRGTILMPLILRHTLGWFVFASTLKYWPLQPSCSPCEGSSPLWILHSLVAEQNVVTRGTGGHCATTVKICLLLRTVKLYHGKVNRWEVITYTLSWKREFKVHCFCFQNPQPPIVLHDILCQQILFFPELACGANKHS